MALRRVPVSTTIFWQQIFQDKRPRSLWQHLRHLLSLLAQIALLLLLVLALGEPYFKSEMVQARRLVLVVDNSASMNATDVAGGRLEAARREADALISSLRFRDEMAIVTGGAQPRVVCGFTGHERHAGQALAQVRERLFDAGRRCGGAGAAAAGRRRAWPRNRVLRRMFSRKPAMDRRPARRSADRGHPGRQRGNH